MVLQYEAQEFTCVSINPYVASMSARGVSVGQTFTFAWTQAMIDSTLHSDSDNALRAMEKMTNASFQRGIQLQKRIEAEQGEERSALLHSHDKEQSNSSKNGKKRGRSTACTAAPTVAIKGGWKKKGGGCLTWREKPPSTIDNMPTLTHKVTTGEWNCYYANVRNTFQIIGHEDDLIKDSLLSCADIVQFRTRLREYCGYEVFQFTDFDGDKLIKFATSMSLPMVVQIHMTSENCTTFTHVIGISPFLSDSSMSMMIIDGAHPDCKPMKLEGVNLAWCSGGPSGTSRYTGFAFMPSAKRSNDIFHLSYGNPIICLNLKFV
jgi:hypothetical protein